MIARVKYVIGKSTKVEFVELEKISFAAVARKLRISTRQVISVIREF